MAENDDIILGVRPQLEGQQQFDLEFSKTMEKAGKSTKVIGKGLERASKDISDALRGVGGTAKAFENMTQAANDSVQGVKKAGISVDEFADDIAILEKRIEATRKTLAKSGNDPDVFGALDLQMRKLLRFQAQFEEDFERAAKDDGAAKAYRQKFDAISRGITGELGQVNRAVVASSKLQTSEFAQATAGIVAAGRTQQAALKKETAVITAEASAQNAAVRSASRERIALVNKERVEFVTAQQREGAQILAETRGNNQRRLQQERAFQRTRLELLRFTVNQIRVLERAVGKVFSGAASILSSGISRIQDAGQRIGKIFNRGNRELNDGLQPALLSRERQMERSFARQNSIVTSSITRQSRTIERFQAQASTGLAGAATGRSPLGSLLGGGLAFGGGFLILDKLKAGFDETVNFNEALNKTRVIFGDVSADIEKFAESSVESLFSTGSAALAAAANFGVFGKSAGLTGKPLADFAKRMTVLATDLASFSNTSVDDAVTAIGAALRGESEPIRKYGVLLNEAVLQTRALELGIIDTKRTLKPSERVLAAYNEILAQTVDAQGDAARTADDFANSSRRAAAASVETAASIAKAFVPFATFLTNFSFVVLPKITAFIEGNVGPGLQILRDGLIGAGAALGGLVAAKGAVEVLKFLAIALRAVLTPMGLFLTAIAAVGAAINIFQDRSPEFAAAIRGISNAVKDILGKAVDLATRGLDKLGQIIDDVILPALEDFARFAGRGLRSALEFGIGFVLTVVVPGFKAFATLLTDTVLPALRDVAGEILERVGPALKFLRDTAGTALEAIMPFLEPAIDGFGRLATAIVSAGTAVGTGDFSGITEALRNFVAGISPAQIASAVGLGAIGTAVGGPVGAAIGVSLGLGLGGSLGKVADVAIDALKPQLQRVADFITGFFTEDRLRNAAIGVLEFTRTLGRIIGDIISDPLVLSAVEGVIALGVAFIAGFVEGVAKNIPALTRQLAKHLELLFTEALKVALDNPATFAKIFAAIFLSATFIRAIRRNMQAAGEQSATGFVGGFTRTVRRGFATNQFATGFFGGLDAVQKEAAKLSTKAGEALIRERDRMARDVARLGGTVGVPFFAASSDGSIKRQISTVESEMKRLQGTFTETQRQGLLMRGAFGDVARGIGGSFRGVGTAIAGDLEGGFARVQGGVKLLGTGIRDSFVQMRSNLAAAGIGIGQAIGGAILAGVGAALAGQALGKGVASGSGTSIALGLTGVISSALFATAATGGNLGVGAAVLAVGAIGTAIGFFGEQSAEAGRKAEEAAGRIDKLTEALLGAKTLTEQFTALTSDFQERVAALGPNAARILEVGEFDLAAFTREVQGGASSVEALTAALNANGDFLIGDAKSANDKGVKDVLEFASALKTEYDAAVKAGALTELFTRNVDGTADALDHAATSAEGAGQATSGWRDNINQTADAMTRRFGEGRILIDDMGQIAIQTGQDFLDGMKTPVDRVGDAIQLLNQQHLEGLNTQIDTVTGKLGAAKDAVTTTLEAIKLLAGGDLLDPIKSATDQLVVSLPGIAESLATALTDESVGPVFDQAQIDTTLAPFAAGLQAIFGQASETFGAQLTPQKLDEIFAPFQNVIDNLPADLRPRFQEILDNVTANPLIDAQVEELAIQQGAVDKLEQDLVDLRAQLPVEVIFSAEQVAEALQELFPNMIIPIDPDSLLARQVGATPFGTANGTPSNVARAEANADPLIREALRVIAATEPAPRRGTADTQEQLIINGDVIGQNVESQVFSTSDKAAVTASKIAQGMRLASASSFGAAIAATTKFGRS